jgi:hypothetical protein
VAFVPAVVYFNWVARRLIEADDAHATYQQFQAENYGRVTQILQHTVQSTLTTVIVKSADLKEALMSIRFDAYAVHFGVPFLPGLRMDHQVFEEVGTEDSASVDAFFKLHQRTRRRTAKKLAASNSQGSNVPDAQNRSVYPIGPCPTLEELEDALDKNPCCITHRFQYSPLCSTNKAATQLFVQFTNETFQMMGLGKRPHPNIRSIPQCAGSLEDAMRLWSVDKISLTFNRPIFKIHKNGLKGPVGNRERLTFTEFRQHIFPYPLVLPKGSNLIPFYDHGFLRAFRLALQDTDDGEAIVTALNLIFSHLQCLPWTEEGSFCAGFEHTFRVNPNAYKIHHISSASKTRPNTQEPRRQRIRPSITALTNMLRCNHGLPDPVVQRTSGRKRKTQKSNHRKPPKRPKVGSGRYQSPINDKEMEDNEEGEDCSDSSDEED